MKAITIHCSDCKPGMLSGESILFNRQQLEGLYRWPMGYIPSLDEMRTNTPFAEVLKHITEMKKVEINLIAHTPCGYNKHIELFHISDIESLKKSEYNLLAVNYKNLKEHISNIGLSSGDVKINLYLFDEDSFDLNFIDSQQIEEMNGGFTSLDNQKITSSL